jgi:hypothetical protein
MNAIHPGAKRAASKLQPALPLSRIPPPACMFVCQHFWTRRENWSTTARNAPSTPKNGNKRHAHNISSAIKAMRAPTTRKRGRGSWKGVPRTIQTPTRVCVLRCRCTLQRSRLRRIHASPFMSSLVIEWFDHEHSRRRDVDPQDNPTVATVVLPPGWINYSTGLLHLITPPSTPATVILPLLHFDNVKNWFTLDRNWHVVRRVIDVDRLIRDYQRLTDW